MKTVLTIEENDKSPRTIAVVDIDKYNIERKIKFIAVLLNIRINIEDYYKLFDELEANKAVTIISNNTNPVCLIFNEIAEY